MRTGYDLGNVLSTSGTEFLTNGDLSAAERIPGGFETVRASVAKHGPDNNWIVSACGLKVQGYSWDWLQREEFFAETGFRESRFSLPRTFEPGEVASSLVKNGVLFCEKRQYKAAIAELLGLEAFVDDRIKILLSLPDCVRVRIAFQPRPDELANLNDPRITVVRNWDEAREILGLNA
jgi:hypothetical protein